jgi:hypothetical protein
MLTSTVSPDTASSRVPLSQRRDDEEEFKSDGRT